MPPADDADFELDLDQVFATQSRPAPVASVAAPAPSAPVLPATGDFIKLFEPYDEAPAPELTPAAPAPVAPAAAPVAARAEKSDMLPDRFGRRERLSPDQLGRRFQRPATLVAASYAQQNSMEGGLGGALPDVSVGKKRSGDLAPEFHANRVHAVLAEVNQEEIFAPEPAQVWRLMLRLAGAGMAVIIGIVLWNYVAAVKVAPRLKEAADRNAPAALAGRVAAAKNALANYLASSTPEDRALRVTGGEELLDKMRAYYNGGGRDPEVDAAKAEVLPPRQIGEQFWFPFRIPHARTGQPVAAQMLEMPDGRYLLDWQAFANPGASSWDDIIAQRPKQATQVRALLRPADAYAAPYTKEDYLCYEVISPASATTLHGFASRSERVAQSLVERLKAPRAADATLHLYIMFEDQAAKPDQARITELVEEWVPLSK